MEKIAQTIPERASRMAAEYEKTCTGCAQAVVAGLLDALELEGDDVFRAASGLADGIGLTGDGSCGALTGCAMVLGLAFGRERADHRDMLKPMRSYLLCKELYDDFVRQYGSSRCHDVQKKLMGRSYDLLAPGEFEQALKEGMIEHCARVVGRTAGVTAELIVRERQTGEPGSD